MGCRCASGVKQIIRHAGRLFEPHGEAIARVVAKMWSFTTKNPHADGQHLREIAETEGTRVAASLKNRVIDLEISGMIAHDGLLGKGLDIVPSVPWDDRVSEYVASLARQLVSAGQHPPPALRVMEIGIPAMIFYAFFRAGRRKDLGASR